MGRLTNLKPRVPVMRQALQTHRAGDERIRGSALQAIRERILSRDCGICQCARCRATGELREARIVDHIVPLWAGGRESDENRQAINAECHGLKNEHEAMCRARGDWWPWNGA